MKKILMIILIAIVLTGCNKELSTEIKEYQSLVDTLENVSEKKFMNNYPFKIKVTLEKVIESEIIYRVSIEEATTRITNIKAVAINDIDKTNIFPSIGIFDEQLNMDSEYINSDEGYVKGIILVGYISHDESLDSLKGEFRVLVQYQDGEKTKQVYYRYQKKTN